jgi:ABC-2 type transport system permease protein
MLLMILVVLLLLVVDSNDQIWGYVDHSGFFSQELPDWMLDSAQLNPSPIRFTDENQAKISLQNGGTDVYFVISADYQDSGKVSIYATDEIADGTMREFTKLVRAYLLLDQPQDIATRLLRGNQITFKSLQITPHQAGPGSLQTLVAFTAGFLFMVMVFISSGYLMQAVVEEKENRTVEVLVTSIPNFVLMIGKIIGIIGVGFTQVFLWVSIIVIGLALSGFSIFEYLVLPSIIRQISLLFLYLLPAFVVIASLMSAIGAMVNDIREGQQYAALVTFPVVIPYWIVTLFMDHPNGPVPTMLSFFPLTAPVAITLRMGFTTIPTTQLLSLLLNLVFFAGLSMWFSGRAFKLGFMNYDRKTPLKRIFTNKEIN